MDENWYTGRAAALRKVLATVTQQMHEGMFTPESPDDNEISGRLRDLAFFFLDEMDKCFTGVASFGANVMGAAALETVLLLACMKYRSKLPSRRRNGSRFTGTNRPSNFLPY